MPRFQIHPPLGGIVRSTGQQKQQPYTCVSSSNFWPVDHRDGRPLSATRCPQAQLTPGDVPVNMFAQLNLPTPTAFKASNGVLYKRNNTTGVWAAISSSVGVSTGRAVFAAPFFRKLVIANTGTPLLYDDDLGTLIELAPTTGFVPDDCRVTMNFQSSVWLGGSLTDELGAHTFAACRADAVLDWDFGGDDDEAAYISTGENRGLITEPLTAMAAVTEDDAIIGCQEEVWALGGHPRRGGRFRRISNQTGILGQNAYAITPRGFFFLSHDGLMSVGRGDSGNLTVTPISKAKIPAELLSIDFDIENPTVAMAYSSRWNAIWITVRSATAPQSWAYFLDGGGFYEQPLSENPFVMFPFETLVTEDTCGVLFGGSYLGQFDRTATETMTTSQIIGPVATSTNPFDANIINDMAVLFSGSTTDDDATVAVYGGPTGEAAVNRAEAQTEHYREQITVGQLRSMNRRWPMSLRCAQATLRIDQTASTDRVVFEDAVGNLIKGGQNLDSGETAPVITPPSIPLLEIDVN